MLSKVAACSLVLALACLLAHAETYTFTDGDGDHKWNNENNWEDEDFDPGIPGNTDTAIIPSNKTCNIESGSDGGWVDYLTVNGTLTVSQGLIVDYDLTVGDTVTIAAVTPVGRSLIVNSGGTVISCRRLRVTELELYGTLELWPNPVGAKHLALDLGSTVADTTHTLDGAIYFKDDDPNSGPPPAMSCAHSHVLTVQPSGPQEDGLITASAADNCQPGIIWGC